MAQCDDFNSSNVDSALKRKAISECRLQDPKIWTKISWIRTNFIKDLESGVRKTDFYNFVTENLGKTGYRDVWHLLRIAYPHVDRVRRGRKYMYWGIRYADDKVKFEDTTDDGSGEVDDEDDEETGLESPFENDKIARNENTSLKMEVEDSGNERAQFKLGEPSEMNGSWGGVVVSSGESTPHENTRSPSNMVVKQESDSDVAGQKEDEVLVLEFKDNEVFASFEDYEKSKQTDQNGNLNATKHTKNRKNKKANCNGIRANVTSVSPPLEIFSFEGFKDNENQNHILDISSASKGHHDNGDHRDLRQAMPLKQQERCYGVEDSVKDKLGKQENGSLTKTDWTTEKNPKIRQDQREEFVPNLLQPENINRMCMPLIKEFGGKIPSQTRSPNDQTESSVNHPSVLNDRLNNNPELNISAVNNSKTGSESEMNGKFSCDPLIVSVASIAEMQINKHSDKACSEEIKNILEASQFNSCKSISAQLEIKVANGKPSNGTASRHPLPSRHLSPQDSNAEFVVVQDRGIQVSEHIHTCNPTGKKSLNKSAICSKPSYSAKNERDSKKVSSLNSSNVAVCNLKRSCLKDINLNENKTGQCDSPRMQNNARLWPSEASPPTSGLLNRTKSTQQEMNNNFVEPRFSVANPRNSHLASKVMGNVVSSEEPLMKALVNNPPSYHALMRNKSSDRDNYPSGPHLQTAPRRLLPKSTFSTIVTTAINNQQGLSSSHVCSSPNALNRTIPTIQERPSLQIPHHPPLEEQSFADNVNKIPAHQLPTHNERNEEQYSPNGSILRNREFVRKLLADHDAKNNSSTCTSTSDLQVTVDCLSSELDKERTMRLRLEIELRKVENQLKEERKLNERLASLLMNR